jgi:hypothetical protein
LSLPTREHYQPGSRQVVACESAAKACESDALPDLVATRFRLAVKRGAAAAQQMATQKNTDTAVHTVITMPSMPHS